MPKVYCRHKGRYDNLGELHNIVVKEDTLVSDMIVSVIIELGRNEDGQTINSKIIFVKDKNNVENFNISL